MYRHGCTADLLSRSEVLRRLYCPHHPHLPPLARVSVRVLDEDCEDPFHAIRHLREFSDGRGANAGASPYHQVAASSVAGYRWV